MKKEKVTRQKGKKINTKHANNNDIIIKITNVF